MTLFIYLKHKQQKVLDGKAPPVGHSITHHLPKLHPLLVSQQVPRASAADYLSQGVLHSSSLRDSLNLTTLWK